MLDNHKALAFRPEFRKLADSVQLSSVHEFQAMVVQLKQLIVKRAGNRSRVLASQSPTEQESDDCAPLALRASFDKVDGNVAHE